MRYGTWSVERIWSSPGTLHSPADAPGTYCVLVSVEGVVTIDTGRGAFTLAEHQVALIEADAPVTATSSGASARLEARFVSTRLSAGRFRSALGTPFDVPESSWQLMAATLNTLIASPPDARGAGTAAIRSVLEEVVFSVFAETKAGEDSSVGTHSDQLYWQATTLIGRRFASPEFSVQELASKLALSQTHLHRLFATRSTTPRKAIELARVRAAKDALAQLRRPSPAETAAVAEGSGFTSVRQMRAAVQRQG